VTGNTIVIKSSEETPINAYEFAELVAETSLPKGVFNVVSGRGATTGQALTSHKDVGCVSFTGSVETGVRIMQAAAANLTRVNLELGGKAPAIVLADCDLDQAAKFVYDSRVINSGQACNCAERVYVDRRIVDKFAEKVKAHMMATTFGDPIADPSVAMGPLINKAGVDKIAAMVESAKKAGAQVLTGGKVADVKKGFHYEPTVLLGCSTGMDVMTKELFGPVLPIQAVDSLDEAIALANDSEFGLAAGIWTRDLARAHRLAGALECGQVFVNNYRGGIEIPFGGYKQSGMGREKGVLGFLEYTQVKNVCVGL